MQVIRLPHHTDWPGFRRAARRLLAARVPPGRVAWVCDSDAQDSLFDASETDGLPSAAQVPSSALRLSEASANPATGPVAEQLPAEIPDAPAPVLRLPARVLAQLQWVMLHSEPARLPLMYQFLWRCQSEPQLLHDPLDADARQLQEWGKAVTRAFHKMKAFVRFRPVQDSTGQTTHMAWFEPEHHVVDASASFFLRRFHGMRWAILTPLASLHWDGMTLHHGPAADRAQAPPPDAGERLWLTYYAHTFNPARLKLEAMQKEVPRKYWANLPEAQLIAPLAAYAHARAVGMVERSQAALSNSAPPR